MAIAEAHKNQGFLFIASLVFSLLILSNSLVLWIGWVWFYNSDMNGWWMIVLFSYAVIDLVYAVVFTAAIQSARCVTIKAVVIYNALLSVLLFLQGYCEYYYRHKIDWLSVNSGTVKLTLFQEIIVRNNVWAWLYGSFLLGAIVLWFIQNQRHELVRRMSILLAHLLKWEYQPERRGGSWKDTIRTQRQRIALCLRKTPSLKASLIDADWQADVWDDAVDNAIKETGIARKVFPKACPWSNEQIMSLDFYPD
ncbi:DUF29 domain-containing protein [Crenothrix polyspora]|uniref:Uncharacterized protein n=1 Tax=Crenothrix polyspora TaxID=360316 RepID=A0A1R4HD66_9GAMM|nr:DUF29 domain-containing protein [Crenothrix polyspora]SJM94149.1 membrane hypothetical protein [Crenothrix polyspora]